MDNIKVVAYLRLSKEEFNSEKESNSITNQRQIIDNYLKEHKEYCHNICTLKFQIINQYFHLYLL